jgi:peptide/nickel transport system permease protein
MELAGVATAARSRRTAGTMLRTPSGIVGVVLLAVTLVVAFAGPWLTPQSPTALGPPRALPSAEHLLGTDQLGRDVLSRVLHGGLDVVVVPTLATLVAFTLGAAIGMWSGYVGGRSDAVVSRVTDVLISLPPLLLAIVFVAGLGSSTTILVVVSALFFIPRIVRVVRGATAAVATADYVVAARTRGDSTVEIVAREVTPNISGVLVVEFAARLSNVVLFVATLNFLGLGAQPPSSSWGLMVNETTLLLRTNPLAPIVPALLIAALAVSVNLIADQLAAHLARDHMRSGI